MNRGGWEGTEATGKCPAAGDLADSALSRVLPPSLFKSIAQMNTSGLVRGTARTHSRASHTSELLRSRHLAQLTSKTSRKTIQGQITCFSRTASDATEDRAQLLSSQAWGKASPCFPALFPDPARLLESGWTAHPSTSHFTCHNRETNGADRGPPRSSYMWGQAQALHKQIAPWALDFRMGRLRRIWDQAAPRLSLPFSGGSSSESSGCIS